MDLQKSATAPAAPIPEDSLDDGRCGCCHSSLEHAYSKAAMSEEMGIDLLDVSFRIQKKTGVELSQSDWQSLLMDGDVLVGDLYSLLLCRLKYSSDVKSDIQLNESVWRQTRLAISQVANLPASGITMQRRLEELLPESSRPEIWKKLQATMKLSVPMLELPAPLRRRQ